MVLLDASPTISSAVDQQIKQYRFKIEAVFDHKEAREAFREYLKKDCLNEEPLLFYEHVEKYLNTRLDKNRLELAAEITENFIIVGAKHELNLSMSIRNDILTRWEQIEEQNKNITGEDLIACPIDIFSRAQDVTFIEMKQDNFPRFVDSDIFKKFIVREMKKNDHILESLGTYKFNSRTGSLGSISSEDLMNGISPASPSVSSANSSLHPISHQATHSSFTGNMTPRSSEDSESDSLDEKIANFYEKQDELTESSLLPIIDEMSPYISPKDYDLGMKLLNSLNDSNMWKTIDEKVGLKTLVSNPVYSFTPRKSGTGKMIICNSGILTGKPREWLNLLFSDSINKMIHDKMKKRFQVDYIKINPKNGAHYPNTIVYTEAQFPFPLTNRDFIFCRSVIPDLYNEETKEYDRYIFIQKPTHHHEYPVRNSPIRGIHYIFYIVEKKTQSSVKYSVFETGDLCGKLPSKIVSSFFKSISSFMHKKVLKACEKIYHDEIISKDADGALSTLNEMLKYLENERANKSETTK